MVKTTRIKTGAIHVKVPASMAVSERTTAAVVQRVTARIERQAGLRLPSAAADQLHARLARALTGARSK
jgi:hypothetical protein